MQSLALLSGLRIRHCREVWCRSQTRLGSHNAVAVVQASSYRSDLTPSLGISICRGCSPKKTKKEKKKKRKRRSQAIKWSVRALRVPALPLRSAFLVPVFTFLMMQPC